MYNGWMEEMFGQRTEEQGNTRKCKKCKENAQRKRLQQTMRVIRK